MSTRFGTCVGHSANSIVLNTQPESSNIAWHVKFMMKTVVLEIRVIVATKRGDFSVYFRSQAYE